MAFCSWLNNSLQCLTKTGYTWDASQYPDRLTIHIPRVAEENIGSYTCEVPTSEYQLGLCRVTSESGGKYLHNNNTEREMLHFYSSLHVCVVFFHNSTFPKYTIVFTQKTWKRECKVSYNPGNTHEYNRQHWPSLKLVSIFHLQGRQQIKYFLCQQEVAWHPSTKPVFQLVSSQKRTALFTPQI